ncbi:MAG: DNA-packaging protein [Pseudomonadota bacterium]
MRQGPAAWRAVISDIDASAARQLLHDWRFWARPKQLPPPGDWFCWLVVAGRGFGKTRLGVEWVRRFVEGASPLLAPGHAPARIALVAGSLADGRDILVEGESGFLACAPPGQRPCFEAARRRLVWPNGAVATLYSADEPDQLRGPQHGLAWGDELAKWHRAEAVWSNLLLGLRLGARPRLLVTTTPRPMALLRNLLAAPATVVTRGTTWENATHLPAGFIAQMRERYQGTRLGRQELEGMLLEDHAGALWRQDMIDAYRVEAPPPLMRVVVAVDPPVTSHATSDRCGIVTAGLGPDGHFYVLADDSVQGLSPEGWSQRAVAAYDRHGADRLVAEVNNGGDLVEAVLRACASHVAYRAVRASRGKLIRAEPVAALYERGQVHHVGLMLELEDEMCSFAPAGGKASPDRMDALVWALTDLMGASAAAAPRVRRLG